MIQLFIKTQIDPFIVLQLSLQLLNFLLGELQVLNSSLVGAPLVAQG